MRFNKWCYEWLERYKKRFLKDSTYETYSHACKRIYCRKKLDKLTIDDIQNNINKLIDAVKSCPILSSAKGKNVSLKNYKIYKKGSV